MGGLARPVAVVTLLTFGAQIANFMIQIAAAYLFGAGAGMDAYLSAGALPLYVGIAVLGSLGFVFIPVFVEYVSTHRDEQAWEVASSVFVLSIYVLGAVSIVGISFSGQILELVAPGLPESTRTLALPMAMILWPSVLSTGLTVLLTSIYNSLGRFIWPATVPVIGTVIGLALMLIAFGRFGVLSLAFATTASSFLQLLLLVPILLHRGRLRWIPNVGDPGMKKMLRLFVPLMLASIIGKATSIVERYFASSMAEGSISHLSYAFRIVNVLSVLISSGIATVIFPTMATWTASGDIAGLRRTMSTGIRYMWLVIAPAISLGAVHSFPLVVAIFQHGRFSATDSASVAFLLRIYILSLAASCLGNITARAFYVLKDTRTLALMGGIESVAYIAYTALFSRWWGVGGVAVGYVFLFNGSLIWQALIIGRKTGGLGAGRLAISIGRTSAAALLGGLAAWSLLGRLTAVWLQLLAGSIIGAVFYLLGLALLRSRELQTLAEFSLRLLGRTKISYGS